MNVRACVRRVSVFACLHVLNVTPLLPPPLPPRRTSHQLRFPCCETINALARMQSFFRTNAHINVHIILRVQHHFACSNSKQCWRKKKRNHRTHMSTHTHPPTSLPFHVAPRRIVAWFWSDGWRTRSPSTSTRITYFCAHFARARALGLASAA